MPGASPMTTPIAIDEEIIQGRYAEVGEYTLAFESFPRDVGDQLILAGRIATLRRFNA